MKQSTFEIRQRTDELIRNAISIWRQSDNAETLEGLENDPVFRMMLTALAHESNDLDAEIEKFRHGIFEEFSEMMMPYGIGGAVPATVAVTCAPQAGLPSVPLSENFTFNIDGTSFSMIPLLETVVYNLQVASLRRIDGRRWSLELDFAAAVSEFSGWTFAIDGVDFSGLKVFSEGVEVPLDCPWNYADMPYVKCFSFDGMIFNHTPVYNPAITCMDLFARQNLMLFHIGDLKFSKPVSHLELLFEFEGVDSSFVFKSGNFIPNAVILVNAQCKDATLDGDNPIFRIEDNKSLMHLIRPEDDQIFGNAKVLVRKLYGDRFNEASLLKILRFLMSRFKSDYYAFLTYGEKEISETMSKLQMLVERLTRSLDEKAENRISGTYLILGGSSKQKHLSVDVHYVVTDADSCNGALTQNAAFSTPDTIDSSSIRMISAPVPGFGEISGKSGMTERARYYMSCNDRVVTPADIKVFCYTVLMTRFGIAREMVDSIGVTRGIDQDSPTGYSVFVKVALKESTFVKDFSGRIASAKVIIEKMLSVRSTGIYPIKFDMEIKTASKTASN